MGTMARKEVMTDVEVNQLKWLLENHYGWSKLEKAERVRNFIERLTNTKNMMVSTVLRDNSEFSETFSKTMDLRIYNGVLQQRLQGSLGSEQWENVEVIND